MTKRFTVETIEEELYPMPVYYDANEKLGYVEIIHLLNDLHEENQTLKKELLWWKYRCGEDIGESDRMTAKRYKEVEVLDNVIYLNGEIIGCKRLCNLLNEQHETIERLKQNVDELMCFNVEKELLEENEQLKRRLMIAEDKVKGLMK